MCYKKKKKTDEAISTYLNGLDASLTAKNKSVLLYNLGNAYLQKNDLENAQKFYQLSLLNNPQDADAKRNFEIVLKKLAEAQPTSNQQEQDQKEKNKQKNQEQNQNENQKADKKKKNNSAADPKAKEQQNKKEQMEKEMQQAMKNKAAKQKQQEQQAYNALKGIEQKEKEARKNFIKMQTTEKEIVEKDW